MDLNLIRDTFTDNSTIGRLYLGDEFLCYTLENCWKDNKKRISCIPEGRYELTTKEYGRFYDRYGHPIIKIVEGTVPNRSEILIHKGNYPKDTLGCILLGSTKGTDFVGNSSKTYNRIYPIIINQLSQDQFFLSITS